MSLIRPIISPLIQPIIQEGLYFPPQLISKPELVTNGGFDSGGTGWSVTGTTTITFADGVAKKTASAGFSLFQPISLEVGREYRVSIEFSNFSAGVARVEFYGGSSVNGTNVITTNGTFTYFITALTGAAGVRVAGTGSAVLWIDNVSVK